jgi:hypothetical protein
LTCRFYLTPSFGYCYWFYWHAEYAVWVAMISLRFLCTWYGWWRKSTYKEQLMQCRLRMLNTFLRHTPSKEWSFSYCRHWSGEWALLQHFHILTISSTSLALATHCWELSYHESVISYWQLQEVCFSFDTPLRVSLNIDDSCSQQHLVYVHIASISILCGCSCSYLSAPLF